MRRTIKLIAASIGLVIAYVLGSVALAQPASATLCVQLDAYIQVAHSEPATTSTSSSSSLDASSVDGSSLDATSASVVVGSPAVAMPPPGDPDHSMVCLPIGKPIT